LRRKDRLAERVAWDIVDPLGGSSDEYSVIAVPPSSGCPRAFTAIWRTGTVFHQEQARAVPVVDHAKSDKVRAFVRWI
jgi:hypothetical protein